LKKPLNKFALAIGIAGVIYFVLRLVGGLVVAHSLGEAAAAQPSIVSRAMLSAVSESIRNFETVAGALIGATQLIGLAAVIELIDQIRWNALPKS
jgi:hypothetical protein